MTNKAILHLLDGSEVSILETPQAAQKGMETLNNGPQATMSWLWFTEGLTDGTVQVAYKRPVLVHINMITHITPTGTGAKA